MTLCFKCNSTSAVVVDVAIAAAVVVVVELFLRGRVSTVSEKFQASVNLKICVF